MPTRKRIGTFFFIRNLITLWDDLSVLKDIVIMNIVILVVNIPHGNAVVSVTVVVDNSLVGDGILALQRVQELLSCLLLIGNHLAVRAALGALLCLAALLHLTALGALLRLHLAALLRLLILLRLVVVIRIVILRAVGIVAAVQPVGNIVHARGRTCRGWLCGRRDCGFCRSSRGHGNAL